jgi:hypothetical protein
MFGSLHQIPENAARNEGVSINHPQPSPTELVTESLDDCRTQRCNSREALVQIIDAALALTEDLYEDE